MNSYTTPTGPSEEAVFSVRRDLRSAEVDFVTVVIPAFNAARTIDETLRSVRAQTHSNIEIIVVDDGSVDKTADIVSRHAREDARIRLIRQLNGGVARARNRGVWEAQAALIAPIDADDLWSATKLERQIEALKRGGDRVSLVYTLYASIDERSGIIQKEADSGVEGNALVALCAGNFIGNGSSPLIRKTAILEVGGYNTSLREAGAEGCEDYLLYLEIAERYDFSVVREHLTGYRLHKRSMSSAGIKMFRSYHAVTTEMISRHPQYAPLIKMSRVNMAKVLYRRVVYARRPLDGAYLIWQMALMDPSFMRVLLAPIVKEIMALSFKSTSKENGSRVRFQIGTTIRGQC